MKSKEIVMNTDPAHQKRIEAKTPARRNEAGQGTKGHRPRWGLVATLVTVLAICVLVLPLLRRPAAAQGEADGTLDGVSLEASGVIQGEEILLSSEYGGQVVAILVEEGQAVSVGQVLVQLDTELLDTQIDAAKAAVQVAKTGLAQARAGARAGQIAVAEAQLAQAQAARVVEHLVRRGRLDPDQWPEQGQRFRFSERQDEAIARSVCTRCPFRMEDCDFRSTNPPPDCKPCGGYILLSLLNTSGLLTLSDMEAISFE